MENKPKRRREKYNPYTIIYLEDDNRYVIKFKDVHNIEQYVEVTEEIYNIFNSFELKDLTQMNEYDRHIEHSELSIETLNKRMCEKNISVEKTVLDKIKKLELYNAILLLPQKQRKRLILYYFTGLTQIQIAKKEKCSIRAIQYSLNIALKNLKNFLNQTS